MVRQGEEDRSLPVRSATRQEMASGSPEPIWGHVSLPFLASECGEGPRLPEGSQSSDQLPGEDKGRRSSESLGECQVIFTGGAVAVPMTILFSSAVAEKRARRPKQYNWRI